MTEVMEVMAFVFEGSKWGSNRKALAARRRMCSELVQKTPSRSYDFIDCAKPAGLRGDTDYFLVAVPTEDVLVCTPENMERRMKDAGV